MHTVRTPPRRARRITAVAALTALIMALVGVAWIVARRTSPAARGQAMTVPDDGRHVTEPWPKPPPAAGRATRTPAVGTPPSRGPAYLSSVSPDGRYLLDQYGEPYLVRGDAPWALLTRLSPAQADLWFRSREALGFNAAIVSLVGAPANGGPREDGGTFDGLQPFRDGDVLAWQEPYWTRVTDYLRAAAAHGITVLLFPIDGWTIGHAFVPTSIEQCRQYGRRVAERFRDLPNIVWMSGGDYFPATSDVARGSDVDHCLDAMMRGIRGTGDGRPFSMELGFLKSISTDNPYWAERVDWNFVYTYFPTYRAVLDAYARRPPVPAVLGEANYEGENNQPESRPTTNETLRRQVLWALTSGACGDISGSQDWQFRPGWEQRLSTPATEQVARLRRLFTTLPWWRLVPDVDEPLVVAGRGTRLTGDDPLDVLDNDYVTAAQTPDRSTTVIYVPTARTIAVARDRLPPNSRAVWIDPASGERRPVAVTGTFTTPGVNSDGAADWLLLVSAGPSAAPSADR